MSYYAIITDATPAPPTGLVFAYEVRDEKNRPLLQGTTRIELGTETFDEQRKKVEVALAKHMEDAIKKCASMEKVEDLAKTFLGWKTEGEPWA